MKLELILLVINAGSTWFMTGLIWFVQIVHYPLFAAVGLEQFPAYAERHRQLTSLVVAGPMLTEIITALLLAVLWKRSDSLLLWGCFALVFAIWICTLCFSIPCHEKLCSTGFSSTTHQYLVTSNWLRTIFWTIRALLLAFIIYKQLDRTGGGITT